MSRKIRVSKKHGVNPSLLNCFFCGESKGIALLGELPGDKEAPRSIVADYEPCDKCKERQKEYILAIEATTVQPQDKRPPIQECYYPTGRIMWIKDQIIKDMVKNTELADGIIKSRTMLCDTDTINMFIDMFNSIEKEKENETDESDNEKNERDDTGENIAKEDKCISDSDAACVGNKERDVKKEEQKAEATPIVHSKKKVAARKDWTCSECGKTIRKGSEYMLKKVRVNGKFEFVRECIECNKEE